MEPLESSPLSVNSSGLPTKPVNSDNSIEDNEIETLSKKYRLTPKFSRWVELFLDNENKNGLKTFGNQTQSAIHAYVLDPEKQYMTAAVIGNANLKKLKATSSAYLAKRNINYGTMLEFAVKKMINSNSPMWWDRIAYLMDIPTPQTHNVLIQHQSQVDVSVSQPVVNYFTVPEKERRDWDYDFKQFLERKTLA